MFGMFLDMVCTVAEVFYFFSNSTVKEVYVYDFYMEMYMVLGGINLDQLNFFDGSQTKELQVHRLFFGCLRTWNE